jgi:mRNA interferase RelE/StbE
MPELLALEENPRPHGCINLTGHDNLWRVRSGDYRIVYEIHDGHLLVLVVAVAHRREVYDA